MLLAHTTSCNTTFVEVAEMTVAAIMPVMTDSAAIKITFWALAKATTVYLKLLI